ncbi:MAG: hypothetical protein MI923_00995 [Phycisphaerales bacterium]|nr:hypothetical protein [Phycisphaerales bacterium]
MKYRHREPPERRRDDVGGLSEAQSAAGGLETVHYASLMHPTLPRRLRRLAMTVTLTAQIDWQTRPFPS